MPRSSDRPPGMELDAGAVGTALGALGVVHALLQVFFYVFAVSSLTNVLSLGVGVQQLFYAWNLVKPVFTVVLLLASIVNITSTPAALVVALMAAGVATGSAGFLLTLVMELRHCNSPTSAAGLCTSKLRCCVHYATRPECAGLGPCAFPASQADLAIDPDFWIWVYVFTAFLVLEMAALVLSFAVANARRRFNRRLQRGALAYEEDIASPAARSLRWADAKTIMSDFTDKQSVNMLHNAYCAVIDGLDGLVPRVIDSRDEKFDQTRHRRHTEQPVPSSYEIPTHPQQQPRCRPPLAAPFTPASTQCQDPVLSAPRGNDDTTIPNSPSNDPSLPSAFDGLPASVDIGGVLPWSSPGPVYPNSPYYGSTYSHGGTANRKND